MWWRLSYVPDTFTFADTSEQLDIERCIFIRFIRLIVNWQVHVLRTHLRTIASIKKEQLMNVTTPKKIIHTVFCRMSEHLTLFITAMEYKFKLVVL